MESVFEAVRAGGITRLPVRWTQMTAAQRLHDAQGFRNAAANVDLARDRVSNRALPIEDESRAHRNLFLIVEHSVEPRNFALGVSRERIAHAAEFFGPSPMGFHV